MERRTFLTWMGLGWLASSLPIALAACSPQAQEEAAQPPAPKPSSSPAADGFQSAGSVTALDQAGVLKVQKSPSETVLVIRSPDKPTDIIALNAACPHKGCVVEWKSAEKAFVCPCHQSKFGPTGQVLTGPATQPLQQYPAKTQGSDVLVQV